MDTGGGTGGDIGAENTYSCMNEMTEKKGWLGVREARFRHRDAQKGGVFCASLGSFCSRGYSFDSLFQGAFAQQSSIERVFDNRVRTAGHQGSVACVCVYVCACFFFLATRNIGDDRVWTS